jgi:hypothetical protein
LDGPGAAQFVGWLGRSHRETATSSNNRKLSALFSDASLAFLAWEWNSRRQDVCDDRNHIWSIHRDDEQMQGQTGLPPLFSRDAGMTGPPIFSQRKTTKPILQRPPIITERPSVNPTLVESATLESRGFFHNLTR